MDPSAVLTDVARAGPFFTVRTGPDRHPDPGCRPVADLYAERPDPGAAIASGSSGCGPGDRVLAQRIAHVRRVLGSDDRVAASITFQGLAALLVSAPFAAAVVHAVLPELTARTLHWAPSADGPWALWSPDPAGRAVPDVDAAAAGLAAALLDGHLAPLVTAVRAQAAVSPRVLWGNAASTIAAARRMVAQHWPGSADRAAAVARRLLDEPALADLGELLAPQPPDRHWTYRRRTCCLYYRARDGLCGDCVLADAPARR
ncbi:IucA/IucC family C-terminal-domain containing protein [Pseudonocardia sp.]|uniref:IucA/IucC family C-terminal-domain containing protein n=1 Tax=Pseudonocardia sp. TaxID=60912 RepID=UPI00262A391B|nr:IucA/IucC family C-terminal-domain containing protein [Pseudonocardia sp.]